MDGYVSSRVEQTAGKYRRMIDRVAVELCAEARVTSP
jgi:hypothetical protein